MRNRLTEPRTLSYLYQYKKEQGRRVGDDGQSLEQSK